MDNQKTGARGECIACEYLTRQAYEILKRNYRTKDGEIDIIFRDGKTVVFAEVKARSSDRFGKPREAVNRVKQRRLIAAALAFVRENAVPDTNFRFDVIEVYLQGKDRVSHIKNAFEVSR